MEVDWDGGKKGGEGVGARCGHTFLCSGALSHQRLRSPLPTAGRPVQAALRCVDRGAKADQACPSPPLCPRLAFCTRGTGEALGACSGQVKVGGALLRHLLMLCLSCPSCKGAQAGHNCWKRGRGEKLGRPPPHPPTLGQLPAPFQGLSSTEGGSAGRTLSRILCRRPGWIPAGSMVSSSRETPRGRPSGTASC